MKLRSQFFLAFMAVISIGIVSVFVISYDTISYMLLADQRQVLREKGLDLLAQVAENGVSHADWGWLLKSTQGTGIVPVMIYYDKTRVFDNKSFAGESLLLKNGKYHHTDYLDSGDKRYIVVTDHFYQDKRVYHVVFATPLDVPLLVKKVVLTFIGVLAGGVAVSILVSMIMANRLASPLLKLKMELKKVEEQRFADVQRVQASGEIGEVAENAFVLAQKLGQYIATQRQFLRYASHELKTPLMSIRGYAEGIRDHVFTGSSSTNGLNVIIDESQRLTNIVNEMILLAKLESERDMVSYQKTSLTVLLTQSVERLQPLILEHKLSVTFVPELSSLNAIMIHTNEDKTLQAFLNVLSNALRYARNHIVITTIEHEKTINIEVSDDGPGFPEDILPLLFHRFIKGTDGQSGLGLAISRAIIENSGGKISAANAPKGGAIVQIELPIVG